MACLVSVTTENFYVPFDKIEGFQSKFDKDFMKDLGFLSMDLSDKGLVFTDHNGYSIYNEDECYEKIAPYIADGAVITYEDAENDSEKAPPVRYTFNNGKVVCKEATVTITW